MDVKNGWYLSVKEPWHTVHVDRPVKYLAALLIWRMIESKTGFSLLLNALAFADEIQWRLFVSLRTKQTKNTTTIALSRVLAISSTQPTYHLSDICLLKGKYIFTMINMSVLTVTKSMTSQFNLDDCAFSNTQMFCCLWVHGLATFARM